MTGDLDADTARRALWSAVAVAAVVRLLFFVSKWSAPLLLNDSLYYAGQAKQLLQGMWFREPFFTQHPGAEHGPLTSILMAPVSIGDHFYRWQRLVTVATGVALVWVIGRCATDMAGRRAGVAAAWLAALYPNLWMNDGLVMSESVSMLCVAGSLWAAWRLAHADDGRAAWRAGVVLGVALGLGLLARSELALFAPLVAAWVVVARRRSRFDWRPALLALVTCGVLVSPWVAFNLARFERPVVLTTNDGTTWLGSNCDAMYRGGDAGGWTIDCVVADPEYRADEEPSVRSARQRSLGLRYMADHAGEVPRVLLARVARTLDLYGLSDLLHQDVGEERPRWAAWLGIAMFWVLAVLSVVGARRLPRRTWTLLVIPFAVVLATSLLFYGGHRIRSTAEPSLVILSGVAVAWWWGRRRLVR